MSLVGVTKYVYHECHCTHVCRVLFSSDICNYFVAYFLTFVLSLIVTVIIQYCTDESSST